MAGGIAATTASPSPLNAHPHIDKLCSNTEKQFSVLFCVFLQPIVPGRGRGQLPLGGFP